MEYHYHFYCYYYYDYYDYDYYDYCATVLRIRIVVMSDLIRMYILRHYTHHMHYYRTKSTRCGRILASPTVIAITTRETVGIITLITRTAKRKRGRKLSTATGSR